jgi:hypothetical protein
MFLSYKTGAHAIAKWFTQPARNALFLAAALNALPH